MSRLRPYPAAFRSRHTSERCTGRHAQPGLFAEAFALFLERPRQNQQFQPIGCRDTNLRSGGPLFQADLLDRVLEQWQDRHGRPTRRGSERLPSRCDPYFRSIGRVELPKLDK